MIHILLSHLSLSRGGYSGGRGGGGKTLSWIMKLVFCFNFSLFSSRLVWHVLCYWCNRVRWLQQQRWWRRRRRWLWPLLKDSCLLMILVGYKLCRFFGRILFSRCFSLWWRRTVSNGSRWDLERIEVYVWVTRFIVSVPSGSILAAFRLFLLVDFQYQWELLSIVRFWSLDCIRRPLATIYEVTRSGLDMTLAEV